MFNDALRDKVFYLSIVKSLWILSFLIFLVSIQLYPLIFLNYYGFFRVLQIIVFVFLVIGVLIRDKKPILNRKIISKNNIIYFMVFLPFFLLLSYLTDTNSILIFRDFVLAFLSIFIGLSIAISKTEIEKLLFLYTFLVSLCVTFLVFNFSLALFEAGTYLPITKNQVAPHIGISILIIVFLLEQKKCVNYGFLFLLLLINIVLLVLLRGKTTIVATTMVLIIYFMSFRRYCVLFILVSIVTVFVLTNKDLASVIFLGKSSVNDLNGLTSGRVITYSESLKFILDNPILGNILVNRKSDYPPHNYLINLIYACGLLSIPFVLFYLKLGMRVIKVVISIKYPDITSIGFFLVMFLYVLSLAEYTFPFSPFTVCFLPFLCLGLSFSPQQDVN